MLMVVLAACGGREKTDIETQQTGNGVAVGDTAASPPMVATDTSNTDDQSGTMPTATSTMGQPPVSGTGDVVTPTTLGTAGATATSGTNGTR